MSMSFCIPELWLIVLLAPKHVNNDTLRELCVSEWLLAQLLSVQDAHSILRFPFKTLGLEGLTEQLKCLSVY